MNAILCHYWHHPPGGAAPLFVAQREFPNVDEGSAQMGVYYQQLLTLEVVPQLYNTHYSMHPEALQLGKHV